MNKPNPANMPDEQVKLISQMEEMVVDTFNRMKNTCTTKCKKPAASDHTDVMKDEAVCIDRCVAKYMELHDIVGKRISQDKATYDLLTQRPYADDSET